MINVNNDNNCSCGLTDRIQFLQKIWSAPSQLIKIGSIQSDPKKWNETHQAPFYPIEATAKGATASQYGLVINIIVQTLW